MADAAVDAITALVVENAPAGAGREGPRRAGSPRPSGRWSAAYLRPTYRLREKAVRRLQRNRAGLLALRVYRRLRGRSSRSA